jgi:hypothetical protein
MRHRGREQKEMGRERQKNREKKGDHNRWKETDKTVPSSWSQVFFKKFLNCSKIQHKIYHLKCLVQWH